MNFPEEMLNLCHKPCDELEEIILEGWMNVQPDCRPDTSFRAMLKVMLKWKCYLDEKRKIQDAPHVITRNEDIGRAKEKLKMILDSDIMNLSAFDPLFMDKNEEFMRKLDRIMHKIHLLHDNLWDLWAILHKNEEE